MLLLGWLADVFAASASAATPVPKRTVRPLVFDLLVSMGRACLADEYQPDPIVHAEVDVAAPLLAAERGSSAPCRPS